MESGIVAHFLDLDYGAKKWSRAFYSLLSGPSIPTEWHQILSKSQRDPFLVVKVLNFFD